MDFKNLKELFQHFSNEDVCREYLENQRWNGKPFCPYCGHSEKIYSIEGGKRHKCGNKDCHKKFSVTVGTVFENTKIPLSTWFGAIYICTAHKKGISSLQLSRDLSVTQKTAWFMLHRIREMLKQDAPQVLKNTVEIDETYVGGKEGNKHLGKKRGDVVKENLNPDKTPVIGMVERKGKVYAKKAYRARKTYILPEIGKNVLPGSTIITDDNPVYTTVGTMYNHFVINHSAGKYAIGDVHTNTIEGFWSLLKRGIVGIYHQISYKHTNAYCAEFAYRYNTRDISDALRFQESLPLANGKRLKYEQLTGRFYFEK